MQRGHHCHKSFQNLLEFLITFCIAHCTIHSIPKVFFFFSFQTPNVLHLGLYTEPTPAPRTLNFCTVTCLQNKFFSAWNPHGPHHQLLSTFLYSLLIFRISRHVSLICFFFEVTGNMHNLFINQFCGCSFFPLKCSSVLVLMP